MRWARWAWWSAVQTVARAGYWIRPYDDMADARRWVWQPRTPCSRSAVPGRWPRVLQVFGYGSGGRVPSSTGRHDQTPDRRAGKRFAEGFRAGQADDLIRDMVVPSGFVADPALVHAEPKPVTWDDIVKTMGRMPSEYPPPPARPHPPQCKCGRQDGYAPIHFISRGCPGRGR